MSRSGSVDWSRVPQDPDPSHDLGYEWLDLDIVRPQVSADGDADRVVMLPQDDDLLRDDAFLVADESALVDVKSQQ